MGPPADEPTDEALATRAGRGESPAFLALLRRYSTRLVGFLARSCAVPAADSDDVAQEVWLKVWRALPAWVPGHFRGWLFTVARRTADDYRRHRRRRPADPLGDADPPESRAPVGRAAETRDEVTRLRDCLAELPAEFRAAFEGYTSGATYEELAAAAGVPVGTIKSRMSRARGDLRTCMGVEET